MNSEIENIIINLVLIFYKRKNIDFIKSDDAIICFNIIQNYNLSQKDLSELLSFCYNKAINNSEIQKYCSNIIKTINIYENIHKENIWNYIISESKNNVQWQVIFGLVLLMFIYYANINNFQ